MSVEVKSLYADPREIEDVEATAKEVAKVLKAKPNDILKALKEGKESNKRFVWLARKLDENQADAINEALENRDLRKFDLPRYAGLHWRQEQKRSYPYRSLAAHIVGFSNNEDVGSAGIEQSQEDILHGAVLKGWQDRDRLGRVYDESEDLAEREPPKDIVLTIGHSIQYKVEQALEQGVKNANANAGMAIVLDPKTGEILALANYPTFDPNRFTEFAADNFKNRAMHDVYSPGSVFKLITYGSAINENLMNADGEIDCRGGGIEVAKHYFKDSHATKVMSYHEAMGGFEQRRGDQNRLDRRQGKIFRLYQAFRLRRAGWRRASGGSERHRSSGFRLAGRQFGFDVNRIRNWSFGFANGDRFCDDSQ